ncbi:PREDICTED: E3 ubiquitin-protein ligase SINA-like 7 [Brassica oleracea var. oleracea]|uniref:E3 ubiquitin-protein ligase SINA-like 7 n=1 Tax=Brassica oleracea var. oleracea TaxID=109376 RepID=UPI0006A6AFF9|nr:PREDICTED: E3 ubiquitin-protein ligase SINA-like 7 [Brassica oleracea var. oleracea]
MGVGVLSPGKINAHWAHPFGCSPTQLTALPTLSRNRAMERVLELLRVPCPNAGCSETFAFAETSTHVKHCPFTQPTCPFTSCDFTCSFKDLYEHCGYAKHCEDSYMFECGTPVFIHPVSGKRVILKEQTTDEGEGEVVVVECFDTPQGRLFHACCIGPGTAKFSYDLHMYSSSGDSCLFQSKLKRVREVSNEPPCKHVMLVHSSMCPNYKFYICIKQETY